ncbi:protein of unknown function [Xenorhabdus poinarii G6]|uniref:Uncharacterized protein n=1 Tax=Xenorhabdus poinarii G6 TaxID=1354304 RepID=A0A068R117_9GAMM|nr:protein of unknown function [Xenorhabdus poinarii G6]
MRNIQTRSIALAEHQVILPVFERVQSDILPNTYLNNLIEQGPLHVKRWLSPMLGFKSFRREQT